MKTILLKNCREIVHSVDGKPKVGADLSIVESLNEVCIRKRVTYQEHVHMLHVVWAQTLGFPERPGDSYYMSHISYHQYQV